MSQSKEGSFFMLDDMYHLIIMLDIIYIYLQFIFLYFYSTLKRVFRSFFAREMQEGS